MSGRLQSFGQTVWLQIAAAKVEDPMFISTLLFLGTTLNSIELPSAMSRDAKTVTEWNFLRIIPCHGDVIEKEGKMVWRDVQGFIGLNDACRCIISPM